MTDARLPERWLNDRRLLRLPDPAFRLFVVTLMWSVANRTDGVLADDDLALIPGADTARAQQLADAGIWQRDRGSWVIAEFEETQTTAADLTHLADQRRKARDRKRAERLRRADRVTRDVPRDVTADSTRTGQARPGALRGTSTQQESCADEECSRPPRSGCRTCWDHSYLETA